MVCCDQGINDKGCCCCCSSSVGVWIFGLLYLIGFIVEVVDLQVCGGIQSCQMESSTQYMYTDKETEMALVWDGMTEQEMNEMKAMYSQQYNSKIVTIIWTGISLLPFIWVMIASKSVCGRLCLFIQMTINFLGSLVGYIFVMYGMYMWAEYCQ